MSYSFPRCSSSHCQPRSSVSRASRTTLKIIFPRPAPSHFHFISSHTLIIIIDSGLISFASTTLLLSFVNVKTRGVTEPNIAVGMALAVGGLCQFLAGMWEFAAGNTFGATAFSSYGGFWFSFAATELMKVFLLRRAPRALRRRDEKRVRTGPVHLQCQGEWRGPGETRGLGPQGRNRPGHGRRYIRSGSDKRRKEPTIADSRWHS